MKLSKNGHVVETSLPREALSLQAAGYVPVVESHVQSPDVSVIESPKPSPKPSK